MEKRIFSVGELDFIEGKPFTYEYLMYPPNIPQSTIPKDGKFTYQKSILYGEGKWLLNGDDFKMYNVLNNNPFNKTKINIYLTEGHETDRTRKIKEDKDREQEEKAKEQARINAENERIAAENARLAEEKRKQLEEEEKRVWDADAPNREILEEEKKVKGALEKKLRETAAELLRKRINTGEQATMDNVFIGDRVKFNGIEATVIDKQYQIKYADGNTDVVNRDGLFNMTAVERTLKQEAINQSRINIGGTRKRKRKNRKTRYGMETRS
jgi:hypothetical protein